MREPVCCWGEQDGEVLAEGGGKTQRGRSQGRENGDRGAGGSRSHSFSISAVRWHFRVSAHLSHISTVQTGCRCRHTTSRCLVLTQELLPVLFLLWNLRVWESLGRSHHGKLRVRTAQLPSSISLWVRFMERQ